MVISRLQGSAWSDQCRHSGTRRIGQVETILGEAGVDLSELIETGSANHRGSANGTGSTQRRQTLPQVEDVAE
jgi:hypothetical protein